MAKKAAAKKAAAPTTTAKRATAGMCTFAIRLPRADAKRIHTAAKAAGVSATQWALERLRKEATAATFNR